MHTWTDEEIYKIIDDWLSKEQAVPFKSHIESVSNGKTIFTAEDVLTLQGVTCRRRFVLFCLLEAMCKTSKAILSEMLVKEALDFWEAGRSKDHRPRRFCDWRIWRNRNGNQPCDYRRAESDCHRAAFSTQGLSREMKDAAFCVYSFGSGDSEFLYQFSRFSPGGITEHHIELCREVMENQNKRLNGESK